MSRSAGILLRFKKSTGLKPPIRTLSETN